MTVASVIPGLLAAGALSTSTVINAQEHGADPTGAADSSAAIGTTCAAVLAAGGGIAYLPAGTYLMASTVTADLGGVPLYIAGDGDWATVLAFTGSGDTLRLYDSSPYATRTRAGAGVTGLTIDGSLAAAGANGLHAGDILQLGFDVTVKDFTSGTGVLLDNAYWWTEQAHGRIYATNCATHVGFTTSGGTNSFARPDLTIHIAQSDAAFSGVTLAGGATIYDGALRIRGNFTGSASPVASAVLTITGTTPGGIWSQISASDLHIQAECAPGAYTPMTVRFGTPGANFIRGCRGVLDFGSAGVNFTPSNIGSPQVPGALWYSGVISGDPALCPAAVPPGSGALPVVNASLIYAQGYADSSGGLFSYSGDFFRLHLSKNITVALDSPGEFGVTAGGPQRLTAVITQASSGGPWAVTWPHATTPTTATPAVLWPGGKTPVMTTTAGATDVYRLETLDGAVWYGQALQNVK